jgi:radical SAM protein with 4Fe4S-binding SPASM domain
MSLQPSSERPDWLPEELRDLPFGSPEFKDANARLAQGDSEALATRTRGMPTWINLTGTTICNLKCFMCNQFLDPDIPKWIMNDAVYDKVVRELYPFAKTVQFSAFGEPLMTPGMEGKLDDLERTHTKLEMVSNATLMMKESRFREKLLKTLGLVTFSIDGATRETYNSVRTGAEFNEVIDNITRFSQARMEMPVDQRPGMNFNFIMMKRTVPEAPRFVELVKELGGDHIVFNHLVAFHPSLKDESLMDHRAFANEHMDATRQAAAELGVSIAIPDNFNLDLDEGVDRGMPSENVDGASSTAPTSESNPPRSQGKPPVKCWFLWDRVYIGTEGEVVPCCVAGMPFFGNMMQQSFREIWNGETYQTYREHVFTENPHGGCRNCYLIYPNLEQIEEEGYLKY